MANIVDIVKSKGYTCIAHITTVKNYENIKLSGSIHNEYGRYLNKITARGVYSYIDLNFNKPFKIHPGDFPGVYTHLVHDKINFNLSENTVMILFPLELLQQKNWHFNINDRCGAIGYDTYFNETIENSPSINEIQNFYKNYIGNELVFHHSIPLYNAYGVYDKFNLKLNKLYNFKANLELKRNCIFYSDVFYNGLSIDYYNQPNVITTSGDFFINLMRKELPEEYKYLCDNIKETDTRTLKYKMEDIIKKHNINGVDLFTYLHINNFIL